MSETEKPTAPEWWRPPSPPFVEGNAAAVTHGVYSDTRLAPLRDAIFARLVEVAPMRAESDGPALRVLAGTLGRIELAHRHLDEHGLTGEDGELRPIAKEVVAWENAARKLMDRLGLTTAARAALAVQAQEVVTLAQVTGLVQAVMRAPDLVLEAVLRERLGEKGARELLRAFRPRYLAALEEATAGLAELEAGDPA